MKIIIVGGRRRLAGCQRSLERRGSGSTELPPIMISQTSWLVAVLARPHLTDVSWTAPPVTVSSDLVVVRSHSDFQECWDRQYASLVSTRDYSSSVGATYSSSAHFRQYAASHSRAMVVEHLLARRATTQEYKAEASSYGWNFDYESAPYKYVRHMTTGCYVDSPIGGLLGGLELFLIQQCNAVRVTLDGGSAVSVTKRAGTSQQQLSLTARRRRAGCHTSRASTTMVFFAQFT
jgi:hypothetical protein